MPGRTARSSAPVLVLTTLALVAGLLVAPASAQTVVGSVLNGSITSGGSVLDGSLAGGGSGSLGGISFTPVLPPTFTPGLCQGVPCPPGGFTIGDPASPTVGIITSPITCVSLCGQPLAVTFPADDGITNQSRPVLRGTALPLRPLQVTIDDVALPAVLTTADGLWAVPVTAALLDGLRAVRVVEGSGPITGASGALPPGVVFTPVRTALTRFTVDTVAPPRPATLVASGTPRMSPFLQLRPLEAGSTITVTGEAGVVPSSTNTAGGVSLPSLADGRHALSITATDAAGNVSEPLQTVLVLDRVAPSAPEFLSPADGSSTRGPLVFRVRGVAGEQVLLGLQGAEPGPPSVRGFVVPAGGVLEVAELGLPGSLPYDPSADGLRVVSARSFDLAGNASDLSTIRVTLDRVAPEPPTITTSGTVGARPTLSGRAEPGSTVRLSSSSALLGSATTGGTGQWSLALTLDLPEGRQLLTATASDAAGGTSAPASTVLDVDATAPEAPVVLNGSRPVNETPFDLVGTAVGAQRLELTLNGQEVAVATPVGSAWTLRVPLLPDGRHPYSVVAVDGVGNRSQPATGVVMVDTRRPGVPTLTGPSGPTAGQPTLSGQAEPLSRVDVQDGATLLGSATVEADGRWSLQPVTALPEGRRSLTATATDAAGNVSAASAPLLLVVDRTAPVAPVLGRRAVLPSDPLVGGAEPGSTVRVVAGAATLGSTRADSDGRWSLAPATALVEGPLSISLTATDEAGNVSPAALAVVVVDATAPAVPQVDAPVVTGARVRLSGRGEPDAFVAVRSSSTGRVQRVQVLRDGTWAMDLTGLTDQTHTFTVLSHDDAGNVSDPVLVTVRVDTTPPAAPVVLTPTPGSTVSSSPVLSGTAEPGSSVQVCRLTCTTVAGGRLVQALATGDDLGPALGRTVAGADGAWSLRLAGPLAQGTQALVVVVTDAAGLASPPTALSLVVDATPPAPPRLVSPAEGALLVTGRSDVRGTSEPGSLVSLERDGAPAGTTTAGADGTWTVAGVSLADGARVLRATARDGVGLLSAPSAPRTVEVSLSGPAAPAVLLPVAGATVGSALVAVSGTSAPGTVVRLRDRTGAVLGQVTTAASGRWSTTLTLAEGPATLTATATDRADRTSPTVSTSLRVDTVAPQSLLLSGPASGTTRNDADFAFRGDDGAGSGVSLLLCSVDGAAAAPCVSPLRLSGLRVGRHTLTLTAVDVAGNADPTPATADWEVLGRGAAAPDVDPVRAAPSTSTPSTPSTPTSPSTPPAPSSPSSPSPRPAPVQQVADAPAAVAVAPVLQLSPASVVAGAPSALTVTGRPGATVQVWAYTRPATVYRVVRTLVLDRTGTATTVVRAAGTSRLYAVEQGAGGPAGDSVLLSVSRRVTVALAPAGPRGLHVDVRTSPAREGAVVRLLSVGDDGVETRLAQGATDGQGRLVVQRRFLSPGRLRLVVRVEGDLDTASGRSAVLVRRLR